MSTTLQVQQELVMKRRLVIPEIWCYGQYSNDNYGVNCMAVRLGPVTLWFSYSTMIAFQVRGYDQVVRENDWGPTTGRHLRMLSYGGRPRVDEDRFKELWAEQAAEYFAEDWQDVLVPVPVGSDDMVIKGDKNGPKKRLLLPLPTLRQRH